MRVLVVEDDFIIAMELEAILTDAGAKLAGSCRTVAEALAACAADGVDVAILDIRIGEETVAPVARALTARGVPFFFYSGQVETDPIHVQWPEHRILAKPARARAIVDAVAELRGPR